MALTQIESGGIKEDAVTATKIPANAIGSSEIADDAVGADQIADDAIGSAAIADDAVVAAAIADDAVGADQIAADAVVNASIASNAAIENSKLATDPLNASNLNSGTVPTARLGSGTAGNTNFLRGDGTWQVVENYNDDVVMSNIALLGFKTAVNGSLSKYNLVDQIIDEYTDGSGIDASASTNETLASGAYSGISTVGSAATGGTISDIGGDKLHTFTSNGTFTPPSAGTISKALIVGGGGGGATYGGGGGGGAVIYVQNKPLTAQGYSIVVGAGGQGREINDTDASDHEGDTSSAFGYSATGGGCGGAYNNKTATGGANAGGHGAYFTSNAVSGTAPSDIDAYDTVYGGYSGGLFGPASTNFPSGGGAGAGANGSTPADASSNGGNGGNGVQIDIDGNNHYWGGGGGGAVYNPNSGNGGNGGLGGGGGGADNGTGGGSARNSGADGGGSVSGSAGGAGGANTGGGGGGSVYESNNGATNGAAGGSGIVMIRYTLATTFTSNNYANMTLQSNATTAQSAPTKADLVILVEDAAGTATVNTDVKGYISRNGSAFSSAVTFVDEGTWGTNKRIFAAHDVDISGITSGTSMKYKIETLNQAVGKQTKIHAASLGWR